MGAGFIFAGVQVSVYILHGSRILFCMGAGFCGGGGGGPLSIRCNILHGSRIYFCRGAGFWVSVWVVTIKSCMGAGFRFAWVQDFILHGCMVLWWWAVKYCAGFCGGVPLSICYNILHGSRI